LYLFYPIILIYTSHDQIIILVQFLTNSNIVFRITLQVYDGLATQISETVGFAGLPNCGGRKPHKGRSRASAHARLGFSGARAAQLGGEAYTVCYMPVVFTHIFYGIILSILSLPL
jgi:hypothetical protein